MRTIVVVGEGRASARPDLAVTTLGVEILAPTLAGATAEARSAMTGVLQALRSAGLEDRDLRTARYSVQLERPYNPQTGQQGEVTGYRVSNLVQARIKVLERVGVTLDQAVAAGANTVSGVSFTVSDPAILRDQARAAAMTDARSRAEQIANLAGVELGSLVQVSEAPGPAVVGPRETTFALVAQGTPMPIEGGELEMSLHLQVTYEIG